MEQFSYSPNFLYTQARHFTPIPWYNHLFVVFIVLQFLWLGLSELYSLFWSGFFQLEWFCNSSILWLFVLKFVFVRVGEKEVHVPTYVCEQGMGRGRERTPCRLLVSPKNCEVMTHAEINRLKRLSHPGAPYMLLFVSVVYFFILE